MKFNCINVPARITNQYADRPKNTPVFSLLFLIPDDMFFINLGIINLR